MLCVYVSGSSHCTRRGRIIVDEAGPGRHLNNVLEANVYNVIYSRCAQHVNAMLYVAQGAVLASAEQHAAVNTHVNKII